MKIIREILLKGFSLPLMVGVLVAFVGAAFIIMAAALCNDGKV